MKQKKTPIFVSICGPICAGKSTHMKRVVDMVQQHEFVLPQNIKIVTMPEDISLWTNDHGHDWLDSFYKDKERWALSFQMFILDWEQKLHEQMIEKYSNDSGVQYVVLTERCPIDGRYIFMESLHPQSVNDAELQLYDRLYRRISWTPDYVVHLTCSVEKTEKRNRQRKREAEKDISTEYFRSLKERYDSFFRRADHFPREKVIDVKNEGDGNDIVTENAHRILTFIQDNIIIGTNCDQQTDRNCIIA